MQNTIPEVHVYGSGREFVVAPAVPLEDSARTEVLPVQRVSIVMGRPVSVELGRALQESRAVAEAHYEASGSGEVPTIQPWDGDTGRWWAHNLLFVVLRWEEEAIIFAPQARSTEGMWETAEARRLPADTSDLALAEALIAYLGEQLH
ncbi:MAG: hypothetical protein ACP5HG_01920 [Anaerolineae bacterium]